MGTFKIIKQPKVDAEFQIMRVYSSTKKLIDKMSEMTDTKFARPCPFFKRKKVRHVT